MTMEYLTKLFNEALASKRQIGVRWIGKDNRELAGRIVAFRRSYMLVILDETLICKHGNDPIRIKYEKVRSIGGRESPVTIYFGSTVPVKSVVATAPARPSRKRIRLITKKNVQAAK